ncbi:hypothetical protein LTR37_017129 [Vermiconidia calcicola]|uniref:Uncharacterized protein n=1 Tax=Vermiconidia calcicola TaxID=1690605 RepID=A0ACC3MMH2_9PEZI|nr:hypothetical protein LTR37_017129 [Vermiconidia calcicola]
MGAMPDLPRSFPCWCRATYSWGGETKKDLGFVEGDLIEALNAGDGSWWMGRLRRDPRAIGLFPSNFVKLLDESFQPAPNSRNASPLTQPQNQRSSPVKNSLFRKPYQAYEDSKRPSLDNTKDRESTPEPDRKSKFRPYSSMKTAQAPTGTIKKDSNGRPTPTHEDSVSRIPAPPPRGSSRSPRPPSRAPSASPTPTPGYTQAIAASMYRAASPQPGYRPPHSATPSRPHSPLPGSYHDGSTYPQMLPPSRGPSPNPYQQQQYGAPSPQPLRAPSPNPYQQQQYKAYSPQPPVDYHESRAPSPAPFEYDDDVGSSPPPPPPPAHRVAYQPGRPPSPQRNQHQPDDYGGAGPRTPVPPSPGGDGPHLTPSPLRDAMNDVMSSLQDMSVLQQTSQPARARSPPSVWSPEAFEMVRTHSQQQQQRAQSSLGFARQNDYFSEETSEPLPSSRDGPPQLDNFVQRMERQLRHTQSNISYSSDNPPAPPLKGTQFTSSRPTTASSHSSQGSDKVYRMHSQQQHPHMRHRKSAYELGRESLNRTYTTKTNITNSTESSSATQSSNSTQLTSRSIMSGYSAGGFSATSAGSLARKRFGLGSQKSRRPVTMMETKSTPDITSSARSMAASELSGPSYHESHASANQQPRTPHADWMQDPMEAAGVLGGLSSPKSSSKKSNFFRKMIDNAKTTARTGAASARSTIGSRPGSRAGAGSPTKSMLSEKGITGFAGGMAARPASAAGGAARDMGLGGGADWMQVRRDINRSNSLSRRERDDRAERCQMLDIPATNPIEELHDCAEGDEGLDGLPITEPTDFNTPNLALVDKSTRFLQSVPAMTNATTLAQSYVCRPHRSDVQRARAIFTWVAERISWEEDFEGNIDTRRVIHTRRGCSEEIAVLVRDMCNAVGIHAEVIRGYLKAPGEVLDLDTLARPNHWWNAVIVDGEWRVMDCSLASPTNPRRSAYSCASTQVAESWYCLARPMETCYTHIPLLPEQQHIVPPVPHEVLIALPCACPTYFRHTVEIADFDTSMLHLENLEMTHLHINVPEDVECVAETEARGFAQDADGDFFESGESITKKALTQAEWVGGHKRFTIKALLPGDGDQGVLKIYAGKRGLMHTVKDNPHALAFAVPLSHTGQNPQYDFITKHPTPHAQRHDLYIAQPQCSRLVMNNTFVFCIRQHPSSLSRFTPDTWGAGSQTRPTSPNPYARPSSAMSMVSATVSTAGSNYSNESSGQPMTAAQQKPAKLAIQSPTQKIIRLTRKQEHSSRSNEEDSGLTTSWETVIKIGERGTWRGLVLADRSARWCVFAEWECV